MGSGRECSGTAGTDEDVAEERETGEAGGFPEEGEGVTSCAETHPDVHRSTTVRNVRKKGIISWNLAETAEDARTGFFRKAETWKPAWRRSARCVFPTTMAFSPVQEGPWRGG
jgi:hypothetical protein